jgi:hypothetical protein
MLGGGAVIAEALVAGTIGGRGVEVAMALAAAVAIAVAGGSTSFSTVGEPQATTMAAKRKIA